MHYFNLVFCFLPASDFDSGFKASKSTWGEKWIKGNFLLGPLHLIILKKKIIGLANLFNTLVYKLKRIYPCCYMSLLQVWTLWAIWDGWYGNSVTWFCLLTLHRVPPHGMLWEFQLLLHIHRFLLLQSLCRNIFRESVVWAYWSDNQITSTSHVVCLLTAYVSGKLAKSSQTSVLTMLCFVFAINIPAVVYSPEQSID